MKEFLKQFPILRKIKRVLSSILRNISLKYKELKKEFNLNWDALKGYLRLKKEARLSPIRIVIGASGVFEDGWTPTDIRYLNLLIPKHWKRYFRKNSIDAMLSEHVWEHLSIENGFTAAKQCYEYLKPGGYLRVAVPDGNHPDPDYIEKVKVGGNGPGAKDHQVLYTYESFRDIFLEAGFRVELLEYFDIQGNFHFTNWDANYGMIHRSKAYDRRNTNEKLGYTSIILDCHKDS